MSARAECIFCEILAGRAPASFVLRGERVSALLDIQPVTPGHTLIVPNAHGAALADITPADAAEMFVTAQRIASAIRASRAVRCDGVNLYLADGEDAGQEVFHAHLHVVPRFVGDGFGLRFPPRYGERPERETLDALAASIETALA